MLTPQLRIVLSALLLVPLVAARPADRVLRPVDASRTMPVTGNIPRQAQSGLDQGAVDPAMPMGNLILLMKPSAAQQADLDQLLAAQQNPSSPQFHRWLTPEAFGNRFGLSAGDHSKVVAWLAAQGFRVLESGRARNWVAFSGTAELVAKALHTPIHRFTVHGETHFANTADPEVPEALAPVAGGFLGLNDFPLKSMAVLQPPAYTQGANNFLAPQDFSTIYDIAPLYQAGINGTGQSLAVVGESDVLASDLAAFRTLFNLPANSPKMVLFGAIDPGYNGSQIEGTLDLELSGAVAPNATLYYVYSTSAIVSLVGAVNLNQAPVISMSYAACELDVSIPFYRSIAQQANAQGITILGASGDSGAAACDEQESEPLATRGQWVNFPAVLPEVTGVGGSEFVEGSGNYWTSNNSSSLGSALSYIPEAAWNESGSVGLLSGGGGASVFYPRPAWQNGPGVPDDAFRHVPDISFSAALHDSYFVVFQGGNAAVAGTSCGTPAMAGILALLNQYQVSKGIESHGGLGNINPQLYRLAQSAPAAFHDITAGGNVVPCSQGSPNCLAGSFGYQSAAGYDMATGLGSLDVNTLVTQWNTAASGVAVNLVVSASTVSVNGTVSATLLVSPAAGASGTPTGTVSFSASGIALGTVPLVPRGSLQAADVTFPLYQLGPGLILLEAVYSGDAAFSSGGAEKAFEVTVPTGAAAILVSAPDTVWPGGLPDAQGLGWQTTLTLYEVAGVPALVTGFTMDGQPQPLAQYFPTAAVQPKGSLSAIFVLRNVAGPVTHVYGITGTDAAGNSWSRQVSVIYFPYPDYNDFNLTATPLTVTAQPAAVSNPFSGLPCPWPVRVTIDDLGGYMNSFENFYMGSVDMTAQVPAIFGTTRLDAWGSISGTVCYNVIPPATDYIEVTLTSGVFQQVAVTFSGPPANPATLTASPATVSMTAADAAHPGQATLAVSISDKTQPWSLAVFPTNRMGGWLSASQYSGTGPAQVILTASGAGFEPGAYQATIVLQSPAAVPQTVTVPVMFVLGPSGPTITLLEVNCPKNGCLPSAPPAVSAPGGILSIPGASLASTTASATANANTPLPYSLGGVTATVNGLPAPLVSVSPTEVVIQVPYAAGAGPAVVGINNNGQVAGVQVQLANALPVIYTDSQGNVAGQGPVAPGGLATLYLTGVGEVTPALPTAFAPVVAGYQLLQPLSVTVGGIPAFIQYAGLAPGLVGIAQLNILVPASVPAGVLPVAVTVAGYTAQANLTIQDGER